jgi:hypothetical protein
VVAGVANPLYNTFAPTSENNQLGKVTLLGSGRFYHQMNAAPKKTSKYPQPGGKARLVWC